MSSADLPVLHAVTSDDVLARGDAVASAIAIMQAGGSRVAVHLRSATLSARAMTRLAQHLAPEQAATGARLVINDRVDLAMAVGAWGVQLTTRSVRPGDARRIAPALVVGASVHAVTDAVVAERDGAAWVVAGHVYATPTHEGAAGRGEAFVREVCAKVALPVVAIGGITPQRVGALLAAGAQGIAAIRGVWGDSASAAARACADYLSAYDVALDRRGDDRPDRQR
jgi:thiamine-phosphate pyrophosphorylase